MHKILGWHPGVFLRVIMPDTDVSACVIEQMVLRGIGVLPGNGQLPVGPGIYRMVSTMLDTRVPK
jgi:hypothetical protein